MAACGEDAERRFQPAARSADELVQTRHIGEVHRGEGLRLHRHVLDRPEGIVVGRRGLIEQRSHAQCDCEHHAGCDRPGSPSGASAMHQAARLPPCSRSNRRRSSEPRRSARPNDRRCPCGWCRAPPMHCRPTPSRSMSQSRRWCCARCPIKRTRWPRSVACCDRAASCGSTNTSARTIRSSHGGKNGSTTSGRMPPAAATPRVPLTTPSSRPASWSSPSATSRSGPVGRPTPG